MRKTTQCYIRRNGEMLMLFRNKKPDDPNEGKWLGIGGKVEDGETPEAANIREVFEETGISLDRSECNFRGIVKFLNTVYEDEEIYLYTADVSAGTEFTVCDEGELYWIALDKIMSLNMWEGDRRFLKPLLGGEDLIDITLRYDRDKLIG